MAVSASMSGWSLRRWIQLGSCRSSSLYSAESSSYRTVEVKGNKVSSGASPGSRSLNAWNNSLLRELEIAWTCSGGKSTGSLGNTPKYFLSEVHSYFDFSLGSVANFRISKIFWHVMMQCTMNSSPSARTEYRKRMRSFHHEPYHTCLIYITMYWALVKVTHNHRPRPLRRCIFLFIIFCLFRRAWIFWNIWTLLDIATSYCRQYFRQCRTNNGLN